MLSWQVISSSNWKNDSVEYWVCLHLRVSRSVRGTQMHNNNPKVGLVTQNQVGTQKVKDLQ